MRYMYLLRMEAHRSDVNKIRKSLSVGVRDKGCLYGVTETSDIHLFIVRARNKQERATFGDPCSIFSRGRLMQGIHAR